MTRALRLCVCALVVGATPACAFPDYRVEEEDMARSCGRLDDFCGEDACCSGFVCEEDFCVPEARDMGMDMRDMRVSQDADDLVDRRDMRIEDAPDLADRPVGASSRTRRDRANRLRRGHGARPTSHG